MLVRYGRVVMSPSWSTEVFKRRLRHVRYHPNRGAKADIPALHIWASCPEEFHPRALPDPCVNLSIYTAPDVRPFPWHSCQ